MLVGIKTCVVGVGEEVGFVVGVGLDVFVGSGVEAEVGIGVVGCVAEGVAMPVSEENIAGVTVIDAEMVGIGEGFG